jgi:hypothetical protein
MTLSKPPTSLSALALRASVILTVLTAPVLGLPGCSDEGDKAEADKPDDRTAEDKKDAHPLVVLTEREATGKSFHYLHVLEDWPESGELDYDKALELGPPGVMKIDSGKIYFYHAEKGEIEKYSVDDELEVKSEARLSFLAYGIKEFDPEPIWAAKDLAFMVDEKTAQVASFNPTTMKIKEVTPVNPDVLERDELKVQFQLGIAAGKRLFTAVNWRSWETNKVYTATVLGVFDQEDPANGPDLIEDKRCAASVAVGPFKDDKYVYAIGDGVNGFDIIANPMPSNNPQCVVRMPIDGDAFEEDYFIDLQEVTKSPAIYMAYPMAGHKLLVSMWNPDVELSVAKKDATKADWFWEGPPYYQYAIIDLETKAVKKVDGLPDAAARGQKVLIVDERNYVQTFREDKGTDLYRVDPDGKVEKVLESPSSTNVQFIGRL